MVHCTIPTVEILKQCLGMRFAECARDIYDRLKHPEHRECYCAGLNKLWEMAFITKNLICPKNERAGRGQALLNFLQNFLAATSKSSSTGKFGGTKTKSDWKTEPNKPDSVLKGMGFLVTGGQSDAADYKGVEIVNALGQLFSFDNKRFGKDASMSCDAAKTAKLQLSNPLFFHSQNQDVICGGTSDASDTSKALKTCQMLQADGSGWKHKDTLSKQFFQHTSWKTSSKGIFLLGGEMTKKNTEQVGQAKQPFELSKNSWESCAIDLSTSVVLTGGKGGSHKAVIEYKDGGNPKDLQSLNVGRHNHACGWFYDKMMKPVYVVTGGVAQGTGKATDVTEIRVGDANWEKLPASGNLPVAVLGIRGMALDNSLFVMGGSGDQAQDPKLKQILKFDFADGTKANMKWVKTGDLKNALWNFAVSAVDLSMLRNYC